MPLTRPMSDIINLSYDFVCWYFSLFLFLRLTSVLFLPSPTHYVLSFVSARREKNKSKKKGRRGEKRKQTTLIRELRAVGIAKKPLQGKFNLFSLFFLLTESWNYKSRYIHAIPRVSASLQSWGKFHFNSLIFHQKKHLLSHFDLKKYSLEREKLLDLISDLPKVSLSICKIQNCFFYSSKKHYSKAVIDPSASYWFNLHFLFARLSFLSFYVTGGITLYRKLVGF